MISNYPPETAFMVGFEEALGCFAAQLIDHFEREPSLSPSAFRKRRRNGSQGTGQLRAKGGRP